MKLLIGNKNYSSWSLRPWLLLTELGIPFEEEVISFNADDFSERVKRHSPVGKVPTLVDGDVVVWDSLAIVEYIADKFPDKAVWPEDRKARARARSICAEIHSGFQAMRSHLVMNFQCTFPRTLWPVGVQKEIARIFEMWTDCRRGFGAGGPFLFGRFSAADAYYAPVARRFVTYDVKVPEVVGAYMEAVSALPGLRAWAEAARRENDFVPEDEPYREGPA